VAGGRSGLQRLPVELAAGADLLLAEASYVNVVPSDARAYLSSARDAGRRAAAAGAGRLMLTHLWPGTAASAALQAAGQDYDGPIGVATAGLALSLR
jgi:ribonuclease BN (tRNA processing enzyme)